MCILATETLCGVPLSEKQRGGIMPHPTCLHTSATASSACLWLLYPLRALHPSFCSQGWLAAPTSVSPYPSPPFPAPLTERTWLVTDKTTHSPGSRGCHPSDVSLIVLGATQATPPAPALSEEHLLRDASGLVVCHHCHHPRNPSTPAFFLSWR